MSYGWDMSPRLKFKNTDFQPQTAKQLTIRITAGEITEIDDVITLTLMQ